MSPTPRRRFSRTSADPAEETQNMSVPATDSGVPDDERPDGSAPRPGRRPVVLPQAAQRLDTRRELWPDEVRVRVETLNLDAASFRQLESKHTTDDGGRRTPRGPRHRRRARQDAEPRDRLRRDADRHRRGGRPGVAAGPAGRRPHRHPGLAQPDPAGDRGRPRERWDGTHERIPADGYAILFGRSIAATIPDDLPRRPEPVGDGRLRRAGADRPAWSGSTTRRSWPWSAAPASPGR